MSIVYNRENGTITLNTRHSGYQMKADEIGTLLHTWYGEPAGEEDLSYAIFRMNRGFSGNPYEKGSIDDRSYSLDQLPQEISCFGTGDYRASSVMMRQEDGSRALRLRFRDCEIQPGKYTLPGLPASYEDGKEGAETLTVVMEDPEAGVKAELFYGVFPEKDVITRAMRITNTGTAAKTLLKAAPMNLDFISGDYDLTGFYGKWAKERVPEREPVRHGIQSFGSVRGSSSQHHNPSAILSEKNATETQGKCWGFTFVYSGEFLFEAEKDMIDQTRLVFGIHPDNFEWVLEPGESFTTPEVVMTYSEEGFSGISRRFHDFIRKNIVRGPWRDCRRPILINNWEATYFNFTGEKLVDIAKTAKDLGIEMLVMDDGWFGLRNSDNNALGDWDPNEEKLGMSLSELGKRIRELGMRFGIWFEPETISEDSDLFRAHPDWAVAIPGRKPDLSRHELILDMSREDVQDFIIEKMCSVIASSGVSYVKWDFNRSVCDKYTHALPASRQGEMAHRFVLGTYRVLDALLTRFPELLIEGCSGGGGRFDCGMLYYTPQIWCSDNTDPIERLMIQYGSSFIYPVNTMGAHVSASPNHQTGRNTPMETRSAVAMSGTFGYELDPTKLTDAEKEEIRRGIGVFKELYETLQQGDYYRLTPPDGPGCTVFEEVKKDGSKAVVTAVYDHVRANLTPVYTALRGLKAESSYRLRLIPGHIGDERGRLFAAFYMNEPVLTGRTLMSRGIYIPHYSKEYQSWQIVLEEI